MKFILAAVIMAVAQFLIACTNPDHATEILERDGYTDVEMTGYSFFACSEDDFFHTGFTAKKNGKPITGTVCGGFFFKGSTIRFD